MLMLESINFTEETILRVNQSLQHGQDGVKMAAIWGWNFRVTSFPS